MRQATVWKSQQTEFHCRNEMLEYGYVLFVMSTSERAYPDSGSILTLQCGYITRELLMLGAMAALLDVGSQQHNPVA